MLNFVADYSKSLTNDIDPELFDRTEETSIADYICSGLKVIESLPYITFVSSQHITDASKIDVKLNRKHIKSKLILKDKEISKVISIRDTAQEMLVLKFRIDYDDETRYITKNLLIPSYVDKYHMLINGKDVLPQKQIVDMSTYSQKKSVKLKTTLTPIDVYQEDKSFENTDNKKFMVKTYVLNLFTKTIDPLYYYFAKFGIHKTINYFGFSKVIDITNMEYDKNINYYFKCSKDVFVEVDKRYFNESEFVKSFVYLIYDIVGSKDKFEFCDNIEYWTTKLGALFTTNTKNQYSKGLNVLVSFERILDDITKNTLRLGKRNLQSTYSLIRWMIGNYSDLRKKDNHDLTTKRMRCNEVTAFYFVQAMTYRINTLLNKKKVTIESIEKIFNWNPDELFKIMISSKNTLLKYDPNINNFDMLNALRFTYLGAQGISGGKNISLEFRDIYPSHIGRIDLNGISHGRNTALTGFITPRCKIYGNGFFSKESSDPDNYQAYLSALHRKLYDKDIDRRREDINILKENNYNLLKKKSNDDLTIVDGYVVIHRDLKPTLMDKQNKLVIIERKEQKPGHVRTFITKTGVRVTEDGFFTMKRKENRNIENGLYRIIRNKKEENKN